MPRTNFQELLDAGAHFGHLARKWNPKMAPYIFIERNGIHIIDLHKSIVKIDEAAQMMKELARSGRKILFVATKKQAKDIIECCKDDEQEALDNLPDNLQSSERAEQMENYVYAMESVIDDLDNTIDNLTDDVIEA